MKLQELIDNANFKDTLMKFGRMEIQTPIGCKQYNYSSTLEEFSEWKFHHYSLDKYYKTFSRFRKSLYIPDVDINSITLGTSARGVKTFDCRYTDAQSFYKNIKNASCEEFMKQKIKETKPDITTTYKDLIIKLVNNHTAFYIYELTPKFKQKVTVMSGADSKGYSLDQLKRKIDGTLEYLTQQGE